jgi:hypothetical protein
MGKAFNYVRGRSLSDRFWSKVDRSGQCWTWQASLDSKGYGNFGLPRNDGTGRFVMQRAHRVAWMLTHGAMPTSTDFLCHRCDNPRCVNPAHLFIGDAQANVSDCISKGRLNDRSGENNPRAKLTEEQVQDIRSSSASLNALAVKYGVAKSVVASARKGETWRGLA